MTEPPGTVTSQELDDLLDAVVVHGGAVVALPLHRDAQQMLQAIRRWSKKAGLGRNLRLPHHSVTPAGLGGPTVPPKKPGHKTRHSEATLADGGLLVLDEVGLFMTAALRAARNRIRDDDLDVAIVGYEAAENLDPDVFEREIREAARMLELPFIDLRETDVASAIATLEVKAPVDVEGALEPQKVDEDEEQLHAFLLGDVEGGVEVGEEEGVVAGGHAVGVDLGSCAAVGEDKPAGDSGAGGPHGAGGRRRPSRLS